MTISVSTMTLQAVLEEIQHTREFMRVLAQYLRYGITSGPVPSNECLNLMLSLHTSIDRILILKYTA